MMRVTSASYYNNIYGENNKINQQLFDVNKQISSGQKIQYAHEDPSIFVNTLRLDDEITTLTQTKNSAQSAYKTSTQTDTTIGDMVKNLDSMKMKMINAANGSHSDTSLQAIAKELRGMESNLLGLANTSIAGQYIFSGTATTQKPIDANGIYQGNDKSLEAFAGSGLKQKYNITGTQLFLGNEAKVNRTITTNTPQLNLTDLYGINKTETYINSSSTIGDLMGNTAANNPTAVSHFYIQGTKSDGTAFKTKIDLNATDSVNNLLQGISNAYGANQVNVSINPNGQIEIVDKKTGSSKLDFHMVGATNFDPATGDTADVTNISDLQPSNNGGISSNNFDNVISSTNMLYVKEFTKSGFTPSTATDSIEGINYDQTNFAQNGAKLLSNVSQIVKSDNSYANPSSKLFDVGAFSTSTILNINGTQLDGTTPFAVSIDFSSDPVTLGGSALGGNVGDGYGNLTSPANMTYQQLMDIVNVAITGQSDIATANQMGKTSLTSDGKITFEDLTQTVTKGSLSISDSSTGTYPPSGTSVTGSALTFNANNALSIRDPKTDFFAQIDQMIKSVEEGKTRADGTDTTDPRNIGIQNSIQMLDDLSNHISRLQTQSGSYSQVLQASSDRSDLLIVSAKMLRSDVIDTDAAEANLKMQQLSLNYQAMLSSISKVSQLSLVKYL
ncbi:MAG: flagellar biosynthesis protein FlgL [Sulfuricurvum sp.]|jgi:flagellar hook-associated protein 3 FlgL